MNIPVTFTESECHFTPQLGEVVQIGGGGDTDAYYRGYNDGFTAGEKSKEEAILGGEW